jgi:hypothetical protein
LNLYVNRINANFPISSWPRVVTDPASEANPLDSFGFAFSDTGPLTVNNLLDGGQLFAWLEASSSTEGLDAATFTQLGNWTVSLSSNTLTYSTNTTEFAKLGALGWVDAQASSTGSYVAEFENVSTDLSLLQSTAFVNGVAEDTLVSIENVTGGSGADVLSGNGSVNVLTGNGGADCDRLLIVTG